MESMYATSSSSPSEVPTVLPSPLAAALSLTHTLSDREAEVFSLLAHAPSYEEVAEHLGISRRTVRFHIEKIRHKLGITQYHQLCAASYLHALPTARDTGTGLRPREMPAPGHAHPGSRPDRTDASAGTSPPWPND